MCKKKEFIILSLYIAYKIGPKVAERHPEVTFKIEEKKLNVRQPRATTLCNHHAKLNHEQPDQSQTTLRLPR